MNRIKINYIADDTSKVRVYKARKVNGRLILNGGMKELSFRVDNDNSDDSTVEKSVFRLNVLSDESYLGENGGQTG